VDVEVMVSVGKDAVTTYASVCTLTPAAVYCTQLEALPSSSGSIVQRFNRPREVQELTCV
jgi:hypothetical protein